MVEDRLRIWEALFLRALELIDSVSYAGITLDDWSFGGGTVLMRRHHHRRSTDTGEALMNASRWSGKLLDEWGFDNPSADCKTYFFGSK